MGILADAFLLVVDPILTITVDPLRRQYRTLKNKWGGAIGAKDFSSVSSNTGQHTLVARNMLIGWLIYKYQAGPADAQWVMGTKEMCDILSDKRDSGAYPIGRAIPKNDISHFPQANSEKCALFRELG